MNTNPSIRDKVFTLLGDGTNYFENNQQFWFGCGIAIMALLYIKNETAEDDIITNEAILNSSNFKQLKDNVVTLIEQNKTYVDTLPFYKKNLFSFIIKYNPTDESQISDFREWIKVGTLNLSEFYELEMVKLSDYARIHNVTSSAVRYHIYNHNLKTVQKSGRNWVIFNYEPYPDGKKN
jgi:hypothetical protein